ncbi:MAG: SDR family NAD(P)-dependent oxidoreductase [Elusimicrobia bacterium]|nr:SDR family NAD(P)-dependent oxidoreductase [Elusimicrobiota bacterium]
MSDNDEGQVPLAIIGIGCLFPKAGGVQQFWANIKGKVDAITEVPPSHWSAEDYFDKDPKRPDFTYANRGGFLEPVDFDPAEFGVTPAALEATDSAQLLGLVTAGAALRDAGYGPEREFDRGRVSVILGVTGTLELVVPLGARLGHPIWRRALKAHGIEGEAAESIIEHIKDGYVPWQENSFPGLLGNVVSGRIANRFNLGGTNCTVDAACASSLSAAHLASLELSSRRSTMVVTGGVDCFNDIFMYMCFSKTPALSPTGNAKPFDNGADGTILGEGLGMVVLKRLDDAEKDGDRIYAVLKGVGSSSDGRGKSIYAPSAEGQTKALREAYRVSGVSPATIALVEAHGTGTVVGDGAELEALAQVYREAKTDGAWCALGSVKSMIGHTKAAAGSAGMIKAALSLYHKVMPPTIKVSEPLAPLAGDSTPFYLNTEKRPWLSEGKPRRAAVSALGFGGSNFHVILEEHRPRKAEIDWDGDVQIAAFSGANAQAVESELSGWTPALAWDEVRVKAMESRAKFKAADEVRLCIVIAKGKDLGKLLGGAITVLHTASPAPENVYIGRGAAAGIAVLFSGQGSQYVGMGRDVVCQFPQAREMLERDGVLGARIYPHPVLDAKRKDDQEAALRSTDVAQPALGAIGLGLYRVLESFGLKPAALAGHSYGELPALCAAGRISEDELMSLSRLRGTLMAADGGDRGGMFAVSAPLADVERALAEESLDLVVANKNAPQQCVLSGRGAEIERAAEVLARRGLRGVRLPLSAAFHSPLVAAAAGPFREALEKASFACGSAPVYANKTAQVYPESAAASRDLLSAQLGSPVEFVAMVERMHKDGARLFVEVGPGSRLTGLVAKILAGKEFDAVAVDASAGRRSGIADLAGVLAKLAALGQPLRLDLWEGGEGGVRQLLTRKKSKIAVKLTGANYRSTKPAAKPPGRLEAQARSFPPSAPQTSPSGILPDALRAAQESLNTLQKLQEQTALLHAKFLEGQEAAQRQFQSLVEQQQQLFSAILTGVQPPEAAKAALPAPTTVSSERRVDASSVSAPVSNVEQILLAVVSDKTGYPAETLNAEMDLESDLGIDSIKRVEILSAISEKLPGAPKVKPEHLGTLRTLKQIVAFLSQGGVSAASIPPTASTGPALNVEQILLAVVSEKTGYPAETLNPDMDLESDLGIDSIKRVEILSAISEKLPRAPKVKPEHLGTLRTLKQIVAFLSQGSVSETSTASPSKLRRVDAPVVPMPMENAVLVRSVLRAVDLDKSVARTQLPLAAQAPVWVVDDGSVLGRTVAEALVSRGFTAKLVALDESGIPESLAGLIVLSPERLLPPDALWDDASEAFVKKSFALTRRAAPALRAAAKAGGSFLATVSRLDGSFGLSGLKLEQDPVMGALAGLAKTAAREWPEVSCRAIDAAADWADPRSLAGQIVDEALSSGPEEIGLSPAGKKTLTLEDSPLDGRSTAPFAPGDVVLVTGGARGVTAETAVALAKGCRPTLILWGRTALSPEPDWAKDCAGEGELKRALAAREPGLQPKLIGERCRLILASREVRRQLARMNDAGAKAVYMAVDARDPSVVCEALGRIKRDHGPVRGLIHGAGVLADKLIEDKTAEQFDAVFDTKVRALRSILGGLDLKALKAVALFSSTTARFGRPGQCDYALANEALNKTAQLLARRLPDCRVAAFGWGPWDGGMVTEGLKKLFASEGVAVIGLETGARFLADELGSGARAAELVVMARKAAVPAQDAGLQPVLERSLSVADYPFLSSHVINGKAVLPMAVIAELFAHAALHGNPGLVFHGVDDLRIMKGVLIDGRPFSVSVLAGKARRADGFFTVAVELRGPASVLHASASAVLAASLPPAPSPKPAPALEAYALTPDKAYRDVLFHGEDMRFIHTVPGCSSEGIVVDCRAALPPRSWMRQPWRDRWVCDPAALDAAFQAMILWTAQRQGAGCLPSRAQGFRQYAAFPEEGSRVAARIVKSVEGSACADVDFLDARGRLVARLEGLECTVDKSLNTAFRRNALEVRSA